MKYRRIFATLSLLALLQAPQGMAQQEELSEEEQEIIKNLDLLEDLEILESDEDVNFLENYDEVQGEDENEDGSSGFRVGKLSRF